MNIINNAFIIRILFIFILIVFSSGKSDYDLLLEWGLNNSVEISDKIYIEYINENNKTVYTKNKIFKDDEILTIPKTLILNIETALELYGKKAKDLFDIFSSELKDKSDFYIEQAFLAFIMYKINIKEKSNKKFYKHFQYFFNTFETNFDSYPIFYTTEQLNLIRQMTLGFLIDNMKQILNEEITILEKKCKQKKINKEDYYTFRTYSSSKAFNISGHSVIIPFVDMFERHPTKFNCKVIATDYDIKIVATDTVSSRNKLLIKSDTVTNHNALMYFGMAFEEILDRIENYYVPILNPLLIKNHEINLKSDSTLIKYLTEFIEINKRKTEFYFKYLDTYKKLINNFYQKIDNEELSAYNLILENLVTLKEMNENIKTFVYKIFYTQKDINNILIIIKTENLILEEKIDLMRFIINNLNKKIQNQKQKNEEEEINFDL